MKIKLGYNDKKELPIILDFEGTIKEFKELKTMGHVIDNEKIIKK